MTSNDGRHTTGTQTGTQTGNQTGTRVSDSFAARLNARIPTEESFHSELRSPAVASRVGIWLGIAFGICFLTGLLSHYSQAESQPIPFPSSPAWGYRITQGLHVVTGLAAVPLLLVKLWSVFPLFFKRPSRKDGPRAIAIALLEKASIGVLVAASIFQLVVGAQNIAHWYPWGFPFRPAHYAAAWIAIGAMIVHIAVKLPIIRTALMGDVEDRSQDRAAATEPGALSRRGLLHTTWAATAVAVLATAGNTVPWLRKISVFAVRSGEGPQGIPVNRAAEEASLPSYLMEKDLAVRATGVADKWRFKVRLDGQTSTWTLADLQDESQFVSRTETLPIACVEGWSASGDWTGIRLRDLLDKAGVPRGRDLEMVSLEGEGSYRRTLLQSNFADNDRTLIALRLNGEVLDIEHGFPARLIAPNRPGVLQTKWLTRIEVM